MKTIKNILLAGVAAVMLIACGEDFLEKSPTEFVSDGDLQETTKINPKVMDGTLGGIYTLMISRGAGGSTAHEDFGQKSFDILGDLLSSDLALVKGSYNRWVNIVNLQTVNDYTRTIPNYIGWRYYYKIVKASNSVIANLGGNDFVPEKADAKYAMGQAKALRAYAYFYLTQFFAKEYDPEALILPIYTEKGQPAAGKSKMSEVYDLMIADLTTAIDYLNGFERTNKTFINQNVAKGLLAYVYASMGKSETNKLAKKLADEVIASSEFPLMTREEVVGGFTSLKTPGWMWGFDITEANGLSLISWWGMMGYYHYSYQAAGNFKGMDSGLYAQINNKDIRKRQFGDYDDETGKFVPGVGALMPMNKFYNARKKPMGQRTVTDDYVFMRVAEMYLLSAEMAAVEGDYEAAKARLKELLAQRFEKAEDYSYIDGLNGNMVLEEVLLQTRIELLAEGKSYLLMKRRKMTKTRGSNHLYFKGESFQYNDDRLSFVIPQKEVQNNPHIES